MSILIIVESPTKIKTLRKILGSEFSFAASVGHVRDLPEDSLGIDIENDFTPTYTSLAGKGETIAELRRAASLASSVLLSPDPDREGEAIAWHISQLLPSTTKIKRVTFNAITKRAVLTALQSPREINQSLVDAQQARRLLDRLVGYKLSPLLMRRVKRSYGALSAGRVQSAALKLVVRREEAIERFKPTEYWSLSTTLHTPTKEPLHANLVHIDGMRIVATDPKENECTIPNQKSAEELDIRLQNGKYLVEKVEKRKKRRRPTPPCITSTLQQEASRRYSFSASRTMRIAQALYEGPTSSSEGLITYMRTDSPRTSSEGIVAVRQYISKEHGNEFLPENAHHYSGKGEDAHECIRPTNLAKTPAQLANLLTADEFKLYELIWKRFIASQMSAAVYDTVDIEISADNLTLRSHGSRLIFSGFLTLYEEQTEENFSPEEISLPNVSPGQILTLIDTHREQSFTRPPARFTEASLIKHLETSGIGRPSTYAPIMQKIQSRAYTTRIQKSLQPTELGRVVVNLLDDNFASIMDIDFTKQMEDDLEKIEHNERTMQEILHHFWNSFAPLLEKAEKEAYVPKISTDIPCPECKSPLQKVWSSTSYFFGCSNYPQCRYRISEQALNFSKENYPADFDWEQPCPLCGKEMKVAFGKSGPFLGCSTYPSCRGAVSIENKNNRESEETDQTCPAIGCNGKMVKRKSRFGKAFFSCSDFPKCDVSIGKLEELKEKYPSHPKTPYERKTKKRS